MTTTLNASTAGAGGFIATGDNSGSLALQTAGTTAVTIDTSQNVGIGGTGYTEKLVVNGAIVSKGTATANQTSAIALDATYSSSVSAIRAWGASGTTASIAFLTGSGGSNDSERMRIDSSGNLLVGTTSQIYSGRVLNVLSSVTAGSFATTGASSGQQVIDVWNKATSGNNAFVSFQTDSGSERGTIIYNRAGGLTVYNTTSDYRSKTVNGLVQNALSKVSLLKPSTGRMNGATQDIDFFVAHELQEVVPSAVSGEKDAVNEDGSPKYQMVDKSAVIPLLTAAIQELKAINDQQAETINALTARVVALESK
jgi:hypothetical protein